MLDPLTALGVASSVVQLVDFGLKVIRDADKLRGRRSTVKVAHLKVITTDLKHLSENLRIKQLQTSTSRDSIRPEEQALYDLVDESTKVAAELITCLDSLTSDNPFKTWASIRHALRTVWTKEKLQSLSDTLDKFRSQVALRILVLLNTKSDQQASHQIEVLERLQCQNHEVVEILSINNNSWKSNLDLLTLHIKDFNEENAAAARIRHEETIAAILTLRNGGTRTLSKVPIDERTDFQDDDEFVQTSMIVKEGSSFGISESTPGPATAVLHNFVPVSKKISDCLYFQQFGDRVEEISPAYQRTLRWIFRPPGRKDRPWANFVDWLKFGTGFYWVGGKAGSGKSTLMKYIHCHEKTTQALSIWAGTSKLLKPSFFFWNLGSALQKSQSGLLRSLLFDILESQPYMAPSIFPGLCRSALANEDRQLSEPSFAELKKAFLNLAHYQSSELKVCLFVDGVDEYDGDHAELIELLKVISDSPNIKIVLSSRPIPACVEAFSGAPSLALQDLTYNDIGLYVSDKLNAHPNMAKLKLKEPSAAADLISEIRSRASGVFLWVMLVVRSLLHGLRNHDRISDLQQRLEELPVDLENLYEHMLRHMSPLYRQQASQFFQIVLAASKVQNVFPLTLFQLSCAEEGDPRESIHTQIQSFSGVEESQRCESTEERLRSRCCGLVEVQERRVHGERGTTSASRQCVGFLHKTVAEFLQLRRNWANTVDFTASTTFNPHVSLLASCLYVLKAGRQPTLTAGSHELWDFCRSLFLYSMLAEQSTGNPQTEFLNEFDKTMMTAWQNSENRSSDTDAKEAWVISLRFSESFLGLAVRFGNTLYVEEELDQDPSDAQGHSGSVLLREALNQIMLTQDSWLKSLKGRESGMEEMVRRDARYSPEYEIQTKNYADLARIILQHGADTNFVTYMFPTWGDGLLTSPWQQILDHIATIGAQNESFLVNFEKDCPSGLFTDTIKYMIIHGADTKLTLPAESGPRSALDLVRALLTPPPRLSSRIPHTCLVRAKSVLGDLEALMMVCGTASAPVAEIKQQAPATPSSRNLASFGGASEARRKTERSSWLSFIPMQQHTDQTLPSASKIGPPLQSFQMGYQLSKPYGINSQIVAADSSPDNWMQGSSQRDSLNEKSFSASGAMKTSPPQHLLFKNVADEQKPASWWKNLSLKTTQKSQPAAKDVMNNRVWPTSILPTTAEDPFLLIARVPNPSTSSSSHW